MTNNSESETKKVPTSNKSSVNPFLLAALPVFFGSWILAITEDVISQYRIMFLLVLSLTGFVACIKLIPPVKELCKKAGLSGRDINKGGSDQVPESLGIVPALVYIVCVVLFQPFFTPILGEYNAALTSICLMILLGFTDDVLDVRWRFKIFLSFLATLPLLVAYSGPTTIVVPKPLRPMVGDDIYLGVFYHCYMAFIAVFCTNSINIFAGINGLESGQTVVIASSVLLYNITEHDTGASSWLSIFLMLPFLSTTLALAYYNWYPSEVFVGDTFTYFAGMTVAVAGILGHFSKTLLLFFIPQLLNFLISLPQLVWLPCPRHRLPKFNPETGKLEAVKEHFTLINLVLFLLGPMHEKTLCQVLLLFQTVCCLCAFFLRFFVSTYFYD